MKTDFDSIAAVVTVRIDSVHAPTSVAQRHGVLKRDQQCEARLLTQIDAECHTDLHSDVGIQVDSPKVRRSSTKISDAVVHEFVANVTPMILQALTENLETEAFDNWRLRMVQQSQQLREKCQLLYEGFEDNTGVSQISWNASGNLLAVAYGGLQHENFCTHRAGVAVYKVLRMSLGHNDPYCVLDTQNCTTSIAFNPKSPALLAAGTMSGEISVWDLEVAGESKIVAASGIIPDAGHREPISALCWVLKDMTNVEAYQLLSCSLDGKVILWKKPAGGSKELRPYVGLLLISDDLLRTASKFTIKLAKTKPIGISSMAYTRADNSAFLIGTENGAIVRCKRAGLKPDIKESLSYVAALSIGYRCSTGTITDLCFSHHNKDLFLAVATDGTLKLFHSTSAAPLLELQMSTSEKMESLVCCDFSPARPAVFAVGTSSGELLLFDLMQNLSQPVIRLHSGGATRSSLDTVKFNLVQFNLLAAGSRSGVVTVWNLPESLAESDSAELNAFQLFVSTMLK